MRKNKGYTLSEVLIALGIVGVISAMVLPGLSNSYNNKIFASTLSAAVTSFETAISAHMAESHASNVYDTLAWRQVPSSGLTNNTSASDIRKFMDYLSSNLKIKGYKTSDVYNVKSINPNDGSISLNDISSANFDNSVCFEAESGVNYYIYVPVRPNSMSDEQDNLDKGVHLANVAAYVVIDVNGYVDHGKPNTIGRDIFAFMLGSDGIMYPYGGRDAVYILDRNPNNIKIWSHNGSDYACTNNKKEKYGLGCTARLVENGYKMDY